MATNPKYPVEPSPTPRLRPVPVASGPPRSFSVIVIAVTVLLVAAVILVAIWLLKYGGGRPEEQPKPHQTSGTSSGMSTPLIPRIQPRRPPLYAWAK